MNILPQLFFFLLLFMALGGLLVQQTSSLVVMNRALHATASAHRDLRNKVIGQRFRNIKSPSSATTSPAKTRLAGRKSSLRDLSFHSERAELDIACLIYSSAPQQHPLYEVACRFLCLLYPKILDPLSARSLLDAMIAKGQSGKVSSLLDLFPDDPELQKLYYNLLQGAPPSLPGRPQLALALKCSAKSGEKAIHFCFAPDFLLQAIFGAQVSQKILDAEQFQENGTTRYQPLSKANLEKLLNNDPVACQALSSLGEYLDFRMNNPTQGAFQAVDLSTGIFAQKILLGDFSEGEEDTESGALAESGGNTDGAVVLFDNRLDDGKP